MNVPGFTAEKVLYSTVKHYRKTTISLSKAGIYPALTFAPITERAILNLEDWHGWQIVEPNCIRLCLAGYCRWICW